MTEASNIPEEPFREPQRSAQRGQLMLSVKNLKKSFGANQVLKGISFEVYAGETLGIIGPSGCGKSTILKLLCGLIIPDDGEIIKHSPELSLVFQGSALLNSLSVSENLRLALRSKKLKKDSKKTAKFKKHLS